MKKVYCTPSTEMVEIKTQMMLAASPGLQNDDVDPKNIESRRFDFGFDEDEDEE